MLAFGCFPGKEDSGGSSQKRVQCPESELACGGECVQTLTDSLHCGDCDVACAVGQHCADGRCQADCVPGCSALEACQDGQCVCAPNAALCAGACVDLQVDAANCGECGVACSGGRACVSGACQCPAGSTVCGDVCADVLSSKEHCGACGNACGDIEECVSGVCRDTRPDGDNCGGAARGVDITALKLSQAVEVALFEGTEAVPSSERKVDVIVGRDALVRAFIEPETGFVPRDLSFRVHVQVEGQEPRVLHHKRSVGATSSSPSSLDSTLQVVVPAELVTADAQYWVELVECDAPPSGAAKVVRLPETGTQPFEARTTGAVKVAFVPIEHDGRLPDTSEAALAVYANAVLALYPITALETSVTTPMASGTTGIDISLGDILDRVRERRDDDAPDSDVYYYGLIQPSATFGDYCRRGCTTGVAFELVDTTPWYAASRAGVGVAFAEAISAETFAHELGHNHGRPHAPCGVDGDPNFPHSNAQIGEWGYDFFEGTLKDPGEYVDLMSYCEPAWVSDYTYRALTERVAEVNRPAQGFKETDAGPPVTWAAIRVTEAGLAWTRGLTTRQGDTPPFERGVVYDATGRELTHVEVFRIRMSEGAGYVLYVPPAQPGWFAVGLEGGPVLEY